MVQKQNRSEQNRPDGADRGSIRRDENGTRLGDEGYEFRTPRRHSERIDRLSH